ncbi:MAG: class I adenylate cyclase [Gammaproteobacteria bacterium]
MLQNRLAVPLARNMNKPQSLPFDFPTASYEQRFLAVNRERLQRVRDALRGRQGDFIDMLPLLFHYNHPLLPGYVTKDTPSGIAGYCPAQASLRAARRLCRSFELDRRAPPRCAIRGLYLMGSPATVAYSRASDLDLWLVHDPDLPAAALDALCAKAHGIEAFAAGLGLEVHCFVFDAERFRRGETLSLSAESSGSSQHCVLLDEFYRSGVLVAGLAPLWWRVPAQCDSHYAGFVAAAAARRLLDPENYVDFGALPTIPAAEFFGAAVWQLYKSIDSPYKSVLKLLLMESYAAAFPDITLLCSQYKQAIESGQTDLNTLDPYLLMYARVEQYLALRNDPIRLDVARRALYLKTDVRVSQLDNAAALDWRATVMRELVASWGWRQGRTVLLDQRERWRLAVAIDERRDLTNTLKESYACLSRFARKHASELKISGPDLHILGRKLYTAFEKKPAKIDIVTRGICSNPHEPVLSLHEIRSRSGACVWSLYTGVVAPAQTASRHPMKRCASVVDLVAWCHLNRLADSTTIWQIFSTANGLDGAAVRRLHQLLAAYLDGDQTAAATAAVAGDNIHRPRLTRVLLLVNVGVNPFAGSLSQGDVLTSDSNDPLRFGGRGANLVHTLDLVFTTSWGETYAFRYAGGAALLEAARECLIRLVDAGPACALPCIEAHCLGVDHAASIAQRAQATVARALAIATEQQRGLVTHFVIETGNELQHLWSAADGGSVETHANIAMLVSRLGRVDTRCFNKVYFDAAFERSALLAEIYRHNRPAAIQIFAYAHVQHADVYILDEHGALLVQRQACHTVDALFEHYRRFLESALARLHLDGDARQAPPDIETIAIAGVAGRIVLRPRLASNTATGGYLPLHVIADADTDGHHQFTFIVGQREFSTLDHGDALFIQVAEYVHAQRRHGEVYPIYITDLDLSTRYRRLKGLGSLRPIDLLRLKKHVERQLTQGLASATAAGVTPLRA